MKKIIEKILASLFLLAFAGFSIWLVFLSDGIWVSEGGEVELLFVKLLILLFFCIFPLFLLVWILFPDKMNKLMNDLINKGLGNAEKIVDKRQDIIEERNIPNVTVNGVNITTVAAIADMLRDRVSGENDTDGSEPDVIPQPVQETTSYVCCNCSAVVDGSANFCTYCGAARKE